MLSSRKRQEILRSSLLFVSCSKLWRTNCATRKWQLPEQVGEMFVIAWLPPYGSNVPPFLSFQMGIWCRIALLPWVSHSAMFAARLWRVSQASSPGGHLFSSGDKAGERKIEKWELSSSNRKVTLQIDRRWRRHPHSHIQRVDRNAEALLLPGTILIHRWIHQEDTTGLFWAHHCWFSRAFSNSLLSFFGAFLTCKPLEEGISLFAKIPDMFCIPCGKVTSKKFREHFCKLSPHS